LISHDFAEGFPLLTTKKVPLRVVAVELEGFLQGVTSKAWFQERGCHIWDEWCNPRRVPYGTDDATQQRMLAEDDLGFIYGYQWRNFNSGDYDQVLAIEERLRTDPLDRRMVCSAWNPLHLGDMALPPCHILWHVSVIGDRLNLCWFQRSCDLMLGVPFNLASYALLLCVLAKTTGYAPGVVTGFLSDVHIYENHVEGAREQLARAPFPLPTLEVHPVPSVTAWTHRDFTLHNYQHHPTIKFPIAV
jgi:thymidylate synthase